MNLRKTARTVSAAILMAVVSTSASAGPIVLDGWQLWTATGVTTDIGRLNLVSGTSTVEQQVDGTGNAFVGAQFAEFGSIFSVTFTPDNVVGAGDVGAPAILSDSLILTFSNVMGTVTALTAGGGFDYVFDSGTFVLSGIGGGYASGSIVDLGGHTSSTAVLGGFTGDATMWARITSLLNLNFDLRDSSGVSLKPGLATGDVFFEAITQNNTTNVLGVGACSFNIGARCASMNVASAADAYLVRTSSAPEPASLLLVGFGLLVATARRRRSRH